ncbi:hypothetical protein BS47DRAFT_1326125 [Hydnum rufescens UP504]|uniref:Uncharacterized protein n=1 Tax=Hydnum rufescens UP504 TaxID=1448309 RepID=A0A9P6B4W4_9AGAM|nr:hypothetical protein BS47DRAFT_1326125 [Hydnum rufescens UP504]
MSNPRIYPNNRNSTRCRAQAPGRALSIADGAPIFSRGELLLLRIPSPIEVPGMVDVGLAVGSGLPPTFFRTTPQYFAFVCSVTDLPNSSYMLEVYIVLSFATSGGALAGYNQLDDTVKATLIPLPLLSHRHPMPRDFGDPLAISGWKNSRDAWLNVIPKRVLMHPWQSFKRMVPPISLSGLELQRISHYYNTFAGVLAPEAEDRQLWEAPLKQGEEAVGAELKQSEVNLASNHPPIVEGMDEDALGYDFLICEDVDEDAEGDDSTKRDDLILMASASPLWAAQLNRYLLAEREEKEKENVECMERLEHWLNDVSG